MPKKITPKQKPEYKIIGVPDPKSPEYAKWLANDDYCNWLLDGLLLLGEI